MMSLTDVAAGEKSPAAETQIRWAARAGKAGPEPMHSRCLDIAVALVVITLLACSSVEREPSAQEARLAITALSRYRWLSRSRTAMPMPLLRVM
jgi:hypothetical protein